MNFSKPIALVGMMGAGKSHIGFHLAQKLNLEFFDCDKVIEEKAGMSVPDIFEHFGEQRFRQSERNTIFELTQQGATVIATGGGALENPEILHHLREKSIMVWLDMDLEVLWKRVEGSDRPLLQVPDAKKRLAQLLEDRRENYAKAHICVSSPYGSADQVVESIIKSLSAQ